MYPVKLSQRTSTSVAFPHRVSEFEVNKFQLIFPQCPDQLQLITCSTQLPLVPFSPHLLNWFAHGGVGISTVLHLISW